MGDDHTAGAGDDGEVKPEGWPYTVIDGRIHIFVRNKGKVGHEPVANFTANITHENYRQNTEPEHL
ncbi:MAG: hypothetical protein R2867_42155 [Caldilineaceae bacterium]